MIFHPTITGWDRRFQAIIFLFCHGAMRGFIERLADAIGEFSPYQVTGDMIRVEAQYLAGLLIHESTVPVGVQGEESVHNTPHDLLKIWFFNPGWHFRKGISFHTWVFGGL